MVRSLYLLSILLFSFTLVSCGTSTTSSTDTVSTVKPVKKKKIVYKTDAPWVKKLLGEYKGTLSDDQAEYDFSLTIKRSGGKVTGVYQIVDPTLGTYKGKLTNFKILGKKKFQFSYADDPDAGTDADTGVKVLTAKKGFKVITGDSWRGEDTSYTSDYVLTLNRK
jgi:hypothetical protein